jgi:hypothetical protein
MFIKLFIPCNKIRFFINFLTVLACFNPFQQIYINNKYVKQIYENSSEMGGKILKRHGLKFLFSG